MNTRIGKENLLKKKLKTSLLPQDRLSAYAINSKMKKFTLFLTITSAEFAEGID